MRATQCIVRGFGHHLPPRVVANEELPASLELEPAGVEKRTGIRARHCAEVGVRTSDLAAEAGRAALAKAGFEAAPDEGGAAVARRLRELAGLPPAGAAEHPCLLRGAAGATRYAEAERRRFERAAGPGFGLFERLGVDESRGDRLLFHGRLPAVSRARGHRARAIDAPVPDGQGEPAPP